MDVTEEWYWEGNVVEAIALFLEQNGWMIIGKADTRSKERGVDIQASRDGRTLLVEAKGYPSKCFRDPRRAGELKPTNPINQAQQWYSHALLKAMRLQTKHPEAVVALGLPDFPRYRSLFEETRYGLAKLGVAMLTVRVDGIIGFTCHDGVLMMADTEESTTEATKSSCDKLYHFSSPSGYVLTGGAGDAHLIDCANQELATFWGKGMPGTPDEPLTPQLILDGLNIFAQKFFSETTEAYKAAGLDPAPDFEMLIAVNILKKGTFLFKLYLNKVLWIEPPNHECIGTGMWTVDPMLRNFQFVPQKETALFCGIRRQNNAIRLQQPRIDRAHNRCPDLNFRKARIVWIQYVVALLGNNHAGHRQNGATRSQHPRVSETLAGSCGRFRIPSGRQAWDGQFLEQALVERNGIRIERRTDRSRSHTCAAFYMNQDLKD